MGGGGKLFLGKGGTNSFIFFWGGAVGDLGWGIWGGDWGGGYSRAGGTEGPKPLFPERPILADGRRNRGDRLTLGLSYLFGLGG